MYMQGNYRISFFTRILLFFIFPFLCSQSSSLASESTSILRVMIIRANTTYFYSFVNIILQMTNFEGMLCPLSSPSILYSIIF